MLNLFEVNNADARTTLLVNALVSLLADFITGLPYFICFLCNKEVEPKT